MKVDWEESFNALQEDNVELIREIDRLRGEILRLDKLSTSRFHDFSVAMDSLNKAEAKLAMAVDALETVYNNCSCRSPEVCFDVVEEAFSKIRGDNAKV